MTEAEWLISTNAQSMLLHIHNKASKRKLRLFACAQGRYANFNATTPVVPDWNKSICLIETVADGQTDQGELAPIRAKHWEMWAKVAADDYFAETTSIRSIDWAAAESGWTAAWG